MRRLALACLLAVSCKTPAASTAPPNEAPAPTAARVDPELAEVARRLDPGPQAPLHEVLPTWLKDKIGAQPGADPAAPERIAAAREAITAWDKVPSGDVPALLLGALQLGRGLVLAEHAVAAGATDPELLAALSKAYRLVEQLELFQKNNLFGQVLAMASELAQKEGGLEGRQIEEALAALKLAVARAPKLHLHATARLLAAHPDHPTVPEALVRAAQAKYEAEDYAEAVRLRKLALTRKGERASGGDHAGLASTCYGALELECGDMARKTAEALGPGEPGEDKAAAFKKRLADIDASAEKARRALALAPATGLEEVCERAHLLLGLNRYGDAELLFTTLRERFPQDARPRTGLALLAIRRGIDFAGAAAQIRAGRGLAGRDRLYYEIGLGTVPLIAISEISTRFARGDTAGPSTAELAQIFDEIQALAAEYRAFDPPRATLIERLFVLAREAVPKFMSDQRDAALAVVRRLPAEALALTKQFPGSPDAWRLLFSSVRLVDDPGRARTLATTALPPALQQDPDVRLQQVRALVDVALMWEDRSVLAAARKAAATLPAQLDADQAATIGATLDAIEGRLGDVAALERARATFTALAGRKTGKELAVALNNAAMVHAQLGELPAALQALEKAGQADKEAAAVVTLNTAALAFLIGAPREGLNAPLAAVAGHDKLPGLRQHARGWLVALAEAGAGDVKVTREEFAAGLAKEKAGEFRGRLPLGRWGVIEQGSFKVSLGYSTEHGLMLVDEVEPTWWLIAPAPNFDALVAESEKKAGKQPVKGR